MKRVIGTAFLTSLLCLAVLQLVSDGSIVTASGPAGPPTAAPAHSSDTPRLDGTAVVIHRDQVQGILRDKLPGPSIYGGGLLDANHFRMGALRRTAAGQVEIHRDDTDIFYILSGEATIVTGGTPVNPRKLSATETTADSIKDGVSNEVHSGDVVVIPRQEPHWFQKVTSGTEYLVIKVQ